MLSICIPVYNFNISTLIYELSEQMNSLDIESEIIIIDDASTEFKEINKEVCQKHYYIELPENIGRSRIRNLFLSYAKYEYLLFLDCDSRLGTSSFLSNYLKIMTKQPKLVFGGRIYDMKKPERKKMLKWKYGNIRESKPYSQRIKAPFKTFMTNNFLISKKVFQDNKFDERISKYGYEDTFFSFSLKKNGFQITHIDNPVINGDEILNKEYLIKTEEGIKNLINILNFTEHKSEFIKHISLLNFYFKVKKLENIIFWSFIVSKPIVYFLLTYGYANLKLFDYYKLGLLIENLKNKN